MKRMLKNHTVTHATSARVVDGTLILSLPDAIIPSVWRLELGDAKASAMEVRKYENGQFILVLKTPKGDLHDIAPFDDRDKAVAALMAVGHAMEDAHGQIKPGLYATNQNKNSGSQVSNKGGKSTLPALYKQQRKPSAGKWVSGAVAVVLLIVVVNALTNLGPRPATSVANRAGTSFISSTAGTAVRGDDSTGVAISADKFLRAR